MTDPLRQAVRLALEACPFCGNEPSFSGNASEWKDDYRYVELSLGCCVLMTEQIGWRQAREMTHEAKTTELRNRLQLRWNTRTALEQQQAEPIKCPIGLDKKGASQFCSAGYCDACKQQEVETVAWAKEYSAIKEFYKDQTANRSKLPLMLHIDAGLHILTLNNASDKAKAAFCLHPIVQNSEAVDVSWSTAYALACEYRDKANAYLCRLDTDWVTTKKDVHSLVGEMSNDCRDMLIADKRQNYGDFIAVHFKKHARSDQLDRYFRLWLEYLEDTTLHQRKLLTDEDARFTAQQLFLEWNRRQAEPPAKVGYEYSVFQKAIDLYINAVYGFK